MAPRDAVGVDLRCECGGRIGFTPPSSARGPAPGKTPGPASGPALAQHQPVPLRCACGATLGAWRDGVLELGPPVAYWGEVPTERMAAIIAEARQSDWRSAIARWLPDELHNYVSHPDRAAFSDLLPLPVRARILEVGAGLGGISAKLARNFPVVALEGVAERATFLALRGRQDGLENLMVVRGDLNHLGLAAGQFDAVILNGVLEWVPVGDRSAAPRQVQLRFLRQIRELLTPGGMIYLAIENRFGLPQLRGALDHSGLRYTSLLPRPLARAICRLRGGGYRSLENRDYRTYTYSSFGYRRLFRQAGLRQRGAFVCPRGYNLPVDMIPLRAEALAFHARHQDWHAARPVRAWWHRRLSATWIWSAVGGDLAFVLDAPADPTACTN